MSVVPAGHPSGRLSRVAWALVSVVLIVLGFGLGGALRSAMPYLTASSPQGLGAGLPGGGAPVVPISAPSRSAVARPAPSPSGSLPAASPSAASPSAAGAAALVRSDVRRGVPLPKGSGEGRRIVYDESSMHLWVVEADGTITRDYPVTGRPGWPKPGHYRVFSKSTSTISPKYGVTFAWMVRFAHGRSLNIGFHDIPRVIGSGRPIQAEEALGAPVGHGGCVRQRTPDAKWLFHWASIGTPVVVLR